MLPRGSVPGPQRHDPRARHFEAPSLCALLHLQGGLVPQARGFASPSRPDRERSGTTPDHGRDCRRVRWGRGQPPGKGIRSSAVYNRTRPKPTAISGSTCYNLSNYQKMKSLPSLGIQARILVLRERRVLLDKDLASFYGVSTKSLNQAVKRNADRFPTDFCFRLANEEVANLRSQFVTSSSGHGGLRYQPLAFTEHGALMAANVLNSPHAVQMSIVVVRAFFALRQNGSGS